MIHIEQQWAENGLTVEGDILHEKAHDPLQDEKRGGKLSVRGMPVASAALQVRGVCDVVEFHQDERGVPLHGQAGKWKPVPIEYKRGNGTAGESDRAQLCLQGMCLEEMLCCRVDGGYLYYAALRHREAVDFTDERRERVRTALEEMRRLYQRGYTPSPRKRSGCASCSLKEICLPELGTRSSARAYIQRTLREETEVSQ